MDAQVDYVPLPMILQITVDLMAVVGDEVLGGDLNPIMLLDPWERDLAFRFAETPPILACPHGKTPPPPEHVIFPLIEVLGGINFRLFFDGFSFKHLCIIFDGFTRGMNDLDRFFPSMA
jgi:hypothetical protein